MKSIPLDPWPPDFDQLEKIITGRKDPERVHFVELGVDEEVCAYFEQDLFHQRAASREPSHMGDIVPPANYLTILEEGQSWKPA